MGYDRTACSTCCDCDCASERNKKEVAFIDGPNLFERQTRNMELIYGLCEVINEIGGRIFGSEILTPEKNDNNCKAPSTHSDLIGLEYSKLLDALETAKIIASKL